VGEEETVSWWTSKRKVKCRALVRESGCGNDCCIETMKGKSKKIRI